MKLNTSFRFIRGIFHRTQWRPIHDRATVKESFSLSVFPEYIDALKLESEGNFKRAIPLLERVLDVVETATGSSSSLASACILKLALLNAKISEFDAAKGILSEAIQKQGPLKTRIAQLLAKTKMLTNNPQSSLSTILATAETSVTICEAQEMNIADHSSFSDR